MRGGSGAGGVAVSEGGAAAVVVSLRPRPKLPSGSAGPIEGTRGAGRAAGELGTPGATPAGLRGAAGEGGASGEGTRMATPWSSANCITPETGALETGGASTALADAEARTGGALTALTALTATGATTAVGGNGSGAAAWTAARGSVTTPASPFTGANLIAAIAQTAPNAAAARIQTERGRSRTTMTVGSCAAWCSDVMLTGATEPKALAFAATTDDGADGRSDTEETGYASAGVERRMNAAGGDESRMPGPSGAPCKARESRSLARGYVDARTNGGAVTEGSRIEPREEGCEDAAEEAAGATEGVIVGNGAAASAARMCEDELRLSDDSTDVAAAMDARH